MIKSIKIFLPLIVIAFLFVFTAKYGLAKVSEVSSKVAKGKKDVTVLTQKLSLLNDVGQSADQASIASTALPEKNPALGAISQIKLLAINSGLLLSNIKSGGEVKDQSGISKVNVNFEIEGSRDAILKYLQDIETFAPISKVEKVNLNESGPVARGSVTVSTFFAELPKKLPALTEAVKNLTPDEEKTLSEVQALSQPFSLQLQLTGTEGRADPFNP